MIIDLRITDLLYIGDIPMKIKYIGCNRVRLYADVPDNVVVRTEKQSLSDSTGEQGQRVRPKH